MSSHFELWLTDDRGMRLSDLNGYSPCSRILRFSATRVANGIGKIVVDLPGNFDQALLRRDNMIQVWYAPAGGVLKLWRVYFIRGWRYLISQSAGTTLALTGCCTNDLLRRRVVAYPTDLPQSDKNNYSDDMLREFVTEAMQPATWITGAGPTVRSWDNLTVEADSSTGPWLDTIRNTSFQTLLNPSGSGLLPDVCKTSKEEDGEELFFDIVPLRVTGSSINFIFRAYYKLIGADLTATGLTFAPELGNLTDVELEYDYTEEINDSYTGTIGSRSHQRIRETVDETQMRASIWNACEGYTPGGVNNGIAQIRDSRKVRFVGTITPAENCIFGRDWGFGDKVKARYKSFEFTTIIRAVTIQVDDMGKETITARIDNTE